MEDSGPGALPAETEASVRSSTYSNAFNSISIAFFCSPAILFFNNKYKYFVFSIFLLIFFSFYIYGSYKINNNHEITRGFEKTVNVKVISPNFDMRYIHSDKEIKETIKKIVRYSDPNPNKETIFIWPEGVFFGENFGESVILFINIALMIKNIPL